MPTNPYFTPRPDDKKQLENGPGFSPKFNADGLIPCVSTHAESGEVLMLGYMNDIALNKTIETGYVYFWSRSRGKLWFKGESSGMTQKLTQLTTNCDQSAVVAKVTIGQATSGGAQASCHVGYPNCFYRAIPTGVGETNEPVQMSVILEKAFDPDEVYGKQ